MTTEKSSARKVLEEVTGGPLTLGDLLRSIREGEGWSQVQMAERLEISRSHLCDIEKQRKTLSPERAARFASILGYGEAQFVRLALQSLVEDAGLRLRVHVTAA